MPGHSYKEPKKIRTVGVVGTGSVGASWAALFLAYGMKVVAYDPGPNAFERATDFICNAWPALSELGIAKSSVAPLGKLKFVESAAEVAAASDLIQENAPEIADLKRRLLDEIDAAATAEKIILSSTGGIPPSSLQEGMRHPERFVVVHPFNPSHLIPLVEVIGGHATSPEVIDWALQFSRMIGKQPIRLNTEAHGHMTNRLQFALVREAVACLLEGIASARDIDLAVRYGLGPRWTLMGSLLTLHLAGGPGGMKGILDHAGKAIEEWWTPTAAPHLNEQTVGRLVEAAAEVSGGQSVAEWVEWRDTNLVKLLKLQNAAVTREPHKALEVN